MSKITHLIHQNFFLLLLAAYALAALWPTLGLWLRNVQLGQLPWLDGTAFKLSLPLLMLSFLLFNAGLGIKARELKDILKRPAVIIVGFLANLAVPILLVLLLRTAMQQWHNLDELQNLLVGLALISSMPIAGSSAAWSQNANGNLTLSLGLVFLSTLLSPLTTPLVLNIFGFLTTGDYSDDLHEMAAQGTHAFMTFTVVLPAVLGIATHFLLGEKRTAEAKPFLKLSNFIVLLLLNYANAATSLPEAFAKPDWDYLFFIFVTTLVLCATAFSAGWGIARLLKVDLSEKASLMFGLGMNNNGTGLVLAATALSDHPGVLLPMIFYTLIQQVFAAIVDCKVFKAEN